MEQNRQNDAFVPRSNVSWLEEQPRGSTNVQDCRVVRKTGLGVDFISPKLFTLISISNIETGSEVGVLRFHYLTPKPWVTPKFFTPISICLL